MITDKDIDNRVNNRPSDEIRACVDYERSHTNNTWGRGIKDPTERQIAYQSYCDHLSQGKTRMSWSYYNKETGSHWTYRTLEKWVKESDEFEPSAKEASIAKGLGVWEQRLIDSASGDNPRGNIAAIQIALRHRGYESLLNRDTDIGELALQYERVMLMLTDKQAKPLAITSKDLVIHEAEVTSKELTIEAASKD